MSLVGDVGKIISTAMNHCWAGPDVSQPGTSSFTGKGKGERHHRNYAIAKPNSGLSQTTYRIHTYKKKETREAGGALTQRADNGGRRIWNDVCE